jgi:hypothetical protein
MFRQLILICDFEKDIVVVRKTRRDSSQLSEDCYHLLKGR